jgi:F-type H+-transporting ATPase subunit epsilon
MADTFALEVVTPERALWTGPAVALVLRTGEGNLTVLDGHTALIGSVAPGEVRIDLDDGSSVHLAVHGGFLQVDTSAGAAESAGVDETGPGPVPGLSTRVTLLAGIAELAPEIEVDRAEAARAAAEQRLARAAGSGRSAAVEGAEAADLEADVELAEAEAELARAELRLAVAGAAVSG